jgi:tetratricopeptide (TPR) repeat protein
MWISICHEASDNVKTAVEASILIIVLASFSIINFNAFNVLAQIQKEPLQAAKYPSSILIEKGIELVYNQGNYSGAIKYFDSVLSVDPTNIDAIFYKGAALGSLGKTSEAIPFINKAIRAFRKGFDYRSY